MATIAIVGFGWLGTPLGERLVELGNTVVGTTRTLEKISVLKELQLTAYCWNSRDENVPFPKGVVTNIDFCILNFPPGKVESIEQYGKHLLEVAKQFDLHTRFIFVSTTGVYPEHVLDATEDSFSVEEFANTHHICYAEHILRSHLQDRLTIIRMAGLIGPNRHPAKFFADRKAIANGNQPVNLIEQQDSIQIIINILEKGYWGRVVNACADEHPTRKKYYTKACEKFGFVLPEFLEEGIGKVVSNERSKIEIGMTYSKL